jgi:uncharacterized membrane protein
MHWVLALVGAFLGALAGGIDASFAGLVAGAMIGWQGARLAQLKRRVDTAEQALRYLCEPRVVLPTAAPRAAPLAAAAPAAAVRAAPLETPTSADTTATTAPSAGEPRMTEAPGAVIASAIEDARKASVQAEASPAGSGGAQPPPIPARVAPASPATPATPTRPRAAPRAPQGPDLGERIGAALKRWLFEGNVPVKLGMLVLFFGVAAALKYAADQGYFTLPIEFRLAGIAAAAVGVLIWGWRNREVRPAFGLSLQGGAIGVLLLTIFASYKLYGVLDAGPAFALVLVLVAGAALLAVLQNAIALAVLGFVGGYLAPVLISTGSGNHVALFTYYAILNAAVFGIAWLRPWRALNLIGFAFTFIIGLAWGDRYYEPHHFATVEPFLILFFLFYVAIAVLYALRSPDERKPMVDGTLVFGTPLLAFPLQAAMLADDRMGLAYSALAVALLYALLATWLWRKRGLGLLGQSFAALAVGFATLAVPLALSARWTSASWAVEGAALVWLGLRQQRFLPQLSGWALQGLAACAYFAGAVDSGWHSPEGELAIINGHALSVLLMSLSAFFLSWLHERHGGHRLLVWMGFWVGAGWWTVAGVRELVEHFDHLDASVGFVAFAAITVVLAGLLRGVLQWPRLGWLVVCAAVLALPLALLTLIEVDSALRGPPSIAWLVWFAAMAFGLHRLRDPEQRAISLAHVATLATVAFLYGASLSEYAVAQGLDDGWRFVATWVPLIALLLATWRVPALATWPLADRFDRYRMRWFAPACAVLAVAWILALTERGGSAPLPFVPLLNPVELFQLAALLVAIGMARARGDAADGWRPAIAIGAFLFLTFAGLRAVHHATGVEWSPAILDDRVAQVTLTVLWTALGVAAWIYGSRRRLWNVWIAGAILMGVVLAKLVLVDRQYLGNLAGIVSFMAVGGLLVLVGRIAPTPPRTRAVAANPSGDES